MSYRIHFSDEAQKVIKKWKKLIPLHSKSCIGYFPNLRSIPRREQVTLSH